MEKKIILDLCGGTGSWSEPYSKAGYEVKIFDLPNDIRLIEKPKYEVYGILSAPPCTVFANSGARWKRTKEQMLEGLSVMDACLRLVYVCNPKFWALENPVGKMKRYLGPAKLIFNPCDYGDPYTKKTLIWGNFNLPLLNQVKPTEGSKMHLKYGGNTVNTKRKRSMTPPGFAQAFFNANP